MLFCVPSKLSELYVSVDNFVLFFVLFQPFGKRIGSKQNNRTLYVAALKELARVVRPSVGRMVLLTLDRTSYNMVFYSNQFSKIYSFKETVY